MGRYYKIPEIDSILGLDTSYIFDKSWFNDHFNVYMINPEGVVVCVDNLNFGIEALNWPVVVLERYTVFSNEFNPYIRIKLIRLKNKHYSKNFCFFRDRGIIFAAEKRWFYKRAKPIVAEHRVPRFLKGYIHWRGEIK